MPIIDDFSQVGLYCIDGIVFLMQCQSLKQHTYNLTYTHTHTWNNDDTNPDYYVKSIINLP